MINGQKKIVVIGDVFADMIAQVEGFPEKGGRTYGTSITPGGGGTAGNIAAGLAVLGMDTTIVCGIGGDETGDFLVKGLADAGVNTGYLRRKEGLRSGVVPILIDTDGERIIYVLVKGSAFEVIEPEDVSFLDEIRPDMICLTGVMMGAHPAQETVMWTAEQWKGRAKLYFDPNLCYPAGQVPEEIKMATQKLAGLCDVVLTGASEQKALELHPAKGQQYIVKCGGEGSMLLDEAGEVVYRLKATGHKPVDTTGAGDTFMAAYVAAEAKGYKVREAMRYASAAAGISVTRKGARNMPPEQEIKEYLKLYEQEL